MKKVIAAVLISLVLSGCDKKLTYCSFDDNIIRSEQTSQYSIALGRRGIYVLRGKFKVFGKTGRPGELLGYTGLCEFPIGEVISKYPHLSEPEIVRLAEKQAKRLKGILSNEREIPGASRPRMVGEPVAEKDKSGVGSGKEYSVQCDSQPCPEDASQLESQN